MLSELNINDDLDCDEALSYAFFKFDEVVYGYVSFENHLKAEAQTVIDACNKQGLNVHMFTGDRLPCARHIANKLGITK